MTLSQIADIADLLAAAGVILSLAFVYLELRRGNRDAAHHQSQTVIARMNDYRGLTNDPVISDIVLRGRAGLDQLTEAERLTFDRYLRQVLTTIMGVKTSLKTGHSEQAVIDYLVWTSVRDEMLHPGAEAWFADPATKRLFGQALNTMVDEAMAKTEDEMQMAWTSPSRRLRER